MKYLYRALIVLLIFILQSSLCGAIRIIGVAPQLLLCTVTAIAMTAESPVEAALFGLLSGAAYDLLWGRIFGVNALLMMYISVAVFQVAAYVYRKTVVSAVVITVCAAFVYELVFYMISFFMWGENNIVYYIFRIIIPGAAYTACFQFILYPVMGRLNSGKSNGRAKNEI